MLNFSVESKSRLAKLLATENIKIEHRNYPTAAFDLKNRTLICPIWKDMTGEMYDLLLGHEVSHALETPEQGWHNAICDRGQSYKHFLNVVEDARIEKKIKRRYPGIRRSFVNAYKQLIEDDFFGIKGKDLNKMYFIDRLNVYCKAGASSNIKFFNEQEEELLKLVEDAETWNDVLYATEKVWDYSKNEQKQESPSSNYTFVYDENAEYDLDDRLDDADYYEYSDDDTDSDLTANGSEDSDDLLDENTEETDGKSNKKSDEESNDDADSESSEESAGKSDKEDKEQTDNKSEDSAKGTNGDENTETYGDPKCETDETFRKNEQKLLSTDVTSYTYINIPKLKSSKMITTAKEINTFMSTHFSTERIELTELYNQFKSKNEKYIGLLAKEFEMRKAAKAHNRSKVATTGDINLSKIYKYQLDDEIFRKATVVPKGKSHGLVLLLDMSGSMSANMSGSIEQILVLTSFCKKVNIPFKVYGFNSTKQDFNVNECFHQERDTLQFCNYSLIEFMNSSMKTSDFNVAIKNLCGLSKLHDGTRNYYVPSKLTLGRTPLIESMITLQPIVKDFKKNNNLDIVNMVVVHDGDADSVREFASPNQYSSSITGDKSQKYVLRDNSEKLDFPIDIVDYDVSDAVRTSVYKWITQTTGAKIFGFFIVGESKNQISSSLSNRYFDPKTGSVPTFDDYMKRINYFEELTVKIKKEKFLLSKNPGYESFFLILGGKNLQVQDEELTVVGKVTTQKLYTAMKKLAKNKVTNRVLASQFIQGIAV